MAKTNLVIYEGDNNEVVNHIVENLHPQIQGQYIEYDKKVFKDGETTLVPMRKEINSVSTKSSPDEITIVSVWVDPD